MSAPDDPRAHQEDLPKAQEEQKSAPSDVEWTLSGDYFEGCPCGVPCPCIFYYESDVDHCTVINNYYIREGRYDGVDLKGRNIVFVAFPHTRRMYEGDIDGAIYLDEATPESDRKALEAVATRVLDGSWYKKILGIKFVKMERTETPTERSMVIPGIMDLKVKALKGQKEKVQRIEHNVMIGTVIIAPSVLNKYNDYEKSWEFSDRSGFIAPFRGDSKNPRRVVIGEDD